MHEKTKHRPVILLTKEERKTWELLALHTGLSPTAWLNNKLRTLLAQGKLELDATTNNVIA